MTTITFLYIIIRFPDPAGWNILNRVLCFTLPFFPNDDVIDDVID